MSTVRVSGAVRRQTLAASICLSLGACALAGAQAAHAAPPSAYDIGPYSPGSYTQGVLYAPNGDLYAASGGTNKVIKFPAGGGASITIAGTGASGNTGDNGAAAAATLADPAGLALDNVSGDLYISDYGNNNVRKVDGTTGVITTVAGAGGADSFSGDGGPALSARLAQPNGLAYDSGKLYIADSANDRVRVVDLSLGIITTVVGSALNATMADGNGTSATLNNPAGLSIGPGNTLAIADNLHHAVRRYDLTTTAVTTIAGTGSATTVFATNGGDSGQATSATLKNPSGVAYNSAGELLIADDQNVRLRKVDAGGVISTIAGNGSGTTGTSGAATATGISNVYAVTVGPFDVIATGTSGVRRFGTRPVLTSTAPATPQVGTLYTHTFTATSVADRDTTWTSSGTLPTGLTLSSAGVLAGTPTAAGSYSFTVTASNGYGGPTDTLVTMTLAAPPSTGTGGPSSPGQHITTSSPTTLGLGSRTLALNAAASSSASGAGTTGGRLTYSAATPSVCAVDATGVITAVKVGTCTITITAAATATNALTTKNIDITITSAATTALPAGAQRFAGPERVSTSADIAAKVFPTPAPGTSKDVVLTTAGFWADSLAGARLAGQVSAPLLLTDGTTLSPEAAAQIQRLVAAGGTVYLLGGDAALSEAVEKATSGLVTGDTVQRLGGADRYATAAAVADATVRRAGDVGPIYLVTGRDFADGVSVAAYAASTGGVVLLTDGAELPAVTAAYLKEHDPQGTRAIAVGGPAKAAALSAGLLGAAERAVVGADRFETSAKLAAAMKASAKTAGVPMASVGLAGGASWPDALSGSAAMAALGGPLLLTPTGSDTVPASTTSALAGMQAERVLVFGGKSVISDRAGETAGRLLNF